MITIEGVQAEALKNNAKLARIISSNAEGMKGLIAIIEMQAKRLRWVEERVYALEKKQRLGNRIRRFLGLSEPEPED